MNSQNLVVQPDDDMLFRYRGFDLAFRRTYNSLSGHDYQSSDGSSEIGQYGNGWTNSFDAHMSTNNCPNSGYAWAGFFGFSVYDIDGARYDYCFNASGQLVAPPGMQGTSLVANPDGGSFYWTKKTGSMYTFYSPYYGGAAAAYSGRIYAIMGRNRANSMYFSYAWDATASAPGGDSSSSAYLRNIIATTDSGRNATLRFDDFNGRRLLSTLYFPDNGQTHVTYSYDIDGNLISVTRPAPNNNGIGVTEAYSGYHQFLMVSGPRWNETFNGTTATDGGYIAFHMTGNAASQVDDVQSVGVMNPGATYLNDGTGSYLQPGVATAPMQYNYEQIGGEDPGMTTLSDSDGHQVVYYLDVSGRTTDRYVYTGSSWISITKSWDPSDNLLSETDTRGFQTDYAYDTNGNTIAAASPSTTTSSGTFRPTQLYSYDAFHNVVAYCDEGATHAANLDWTSRPAPSDSLCPPTAATARFNFTSAAHPTPPSYEPFGELQSIVMTMTHDSAGVVTPGYEIDFSYDVARQGGLDHGLPTTVAASQPIAQPTDSLTPLRTPRQDLWYDSNGSIVCYQSGTGTWILQYDAANRQIRAADPDDSSAGNGVCNKTSGLTNWNTSSSTTYFPNNEIASTQSSAERVAGTSTTFVYDDDGNLRSQTTHHGCSPSAMSSCRAGVTYKWYDGADRLVEVQEPQDLNDAFTAPWLTRYLYDLTQGGSSLTIGGSAPFRAYGNLYKVQEYAPTDGLLTWTHAPPNPGLSYSPLAWIDKSGTSTDALDRPTLLFRYSGSAPNAPALQTVTKTYDATASSVGLLSTSCNSVQDNGIPECTSSITYDERRLVTETDFSVATSPTRTFAYDPHGRAVNMSSNNGTIQDVYDELGRVVKRTQTTATNSTAVSMVYRYYASGERSATDINAGTLNSNAITYAYRSDGKLEREGFNIGVPAQFTLLYTAAGRIAQRTDTVNVSPTTYVYTNGDGSSSGLLTSLSGPVGGQSSIGYDAEGRLSNYSGFGLWVQGQANTIGTTSYTTRDESSCVSGNFAVCGNFRFVNGTKIVEGRQDSSFCGQTWGESIDVLQGFIVSVRPPTVKTTSTCPDPPATTSFKYDGAGRQIGTVDTNVAKAYDAEDHLTTEQLLAQAQPGPRSQSEFQLAYKWGPNGHPVSIGSTSIWAAGQPLPTDFQYDSAYWDGDALLFTTDTHGAIDDVKLGTLADYTPSYSGLTVFDRDATNHIIGCHSAAGTGAMSTSPYLTGSTSCGSPSSPPFGGSRGMLVGHGGVLVAQTEDGYSDGYNNFQGERTYDQGAGQWNSPDVYRGAVHDPMSQKPYMWNRNNPYVYTDPSGYDSVVLYARDSKVAGVAHTFIEVTRDDGTKVRYSFGPSASDKMKAVGSKLIRQDQNYDHDYTGGLGAWGHTDLANCKGVCTMANGGFDEASLDKNSAAVNQAGDTYGVVNSNSAIYTLCLYGGGGSKCNDPPGTHFTFGWGKTVFSTPQPTPGAKPK